MELKKGSRLAFQTKEKKEAVVVNDGGGGICHGAWWAAAQPSVYVEKMRIQVDVLDWKIIYIG